MIFFIFLCFSIAAVGLYFDFGDKRIQHDTQFKATLRHGGDVVVAISFVTTAYRKEGHDDACALFRAGAQAVISRWALEIEPPPDDRHYQEITKRLHDAGMELYEEVVTAINFVDLPPETIRFDESPRPTLTEKLVDELKVVTEAAEALAKEAGLDAGQTINGSTLAVKRRRHAEYRINRLFHGQPKDSDE